MKLKILIPFLIILISHLGCKNDPKEQVETQSKEEGAGGLEDKKKQRPLAIEGGKFFEKDGRRYLYGGEEEDQHFDITGYLLNDEQFHFGIGRERFPALLEPEFISVAEADSMYADTSRFLILQMGDETKAYSIKDLTRHEVVNDVIDGKPIMAAYCILADLGAIYDRVIGDHKFTFALSGYTYFDDEVWDGLDGFVLWDRETESLWWPLTGNAVSGPMQGTKMKVLDEKYWSQTTWGEIKAEHANIRILKSGQDFERPTEWPEYNNITPIIEEGIYIAPRWGENDKLE